ncbi:MAG: type VI secretion system baseplate subunit TssF [Planctomycetota bacterium]
MRDRLLQYFERELHYIRRQAAEFAAKYPAVAAQLQIETERCEDPHVERLIEANAMLAARVHLRLDDTFPELTEALLGMLYPHYLAPIPSATIARLELDRDQNQPTEGLRIPRHTPLYTRPIGGDRCRFRSVWDETLWPIRIEAAELVPFQKAEPAGSKVALAAIRIELRTFPGVTFDELSLDELTLFLGEEGAQPARLYEALFKDAIGLAVGVPGDSHWRPGAGLEPVGFEPDEGLVDFPAESLLGYRLLLEYFTFPEKFLFARLTGLRGDAALPSSDRLEVRILLQEMPAELERRVTAESFRLGCVPIVNLFPQTADPIQLTHQRFEYPLLPNARSPFAYEVHSVEKVEGSVPGRTETKTYRPFYGIHFSDRASEELSYWHTSRRASQRPEDPGTDVYLRIVDRQFNPAEASEEVLHVKTLCTNRELPSRIPVGDPRGDLQAEGYPGVKKVTCLRKPTLPCRDHLSNDSRWRFISHLSLNWLSLAEGESRDTVSSPKALAAFHEILRLYDFRSSSVTRQRISGLSGLAVRRTTRRVASAGTEGFARGLAIELEFDEERFAGSGAFLFASVLERFLGHYTSINSFTQTAMRTRQREGLIKQWPPRAGLKPNL